MAGIESWPSQPEASKNDNNQEKKIPRPEPNFQIGQQLNVLRTDGKIEQWELEDLGPNEAVVINRQKKLTKVVDLQDLKTWQEQFPFAIGQKVAIFRHGKIEPSGWVVSEANENLPSIVVKNLRLKKTKIISAEDLKDWNSEETLLPGQPVFYTDQNQIPGPGWVIESINPETGLVKITNKLQKRSLEVKADTLSKDHQPNDVRYIKKRSLN